jgi:hypothetical protein
MSAITQLRDLTKVQIGFGVLIAAMTGVGGAALGAKLAVDKLGDKLRLEADEALQAETAKAKEFYRVLNKKDEFETPQDALNVLHPEAAQAATQALKAYAGTVPEKIQYQGITPASPDFLEVTKNVFTDSAYIPEAFDYEKELLTRDPDKPYLITEEEFLEAAPQYEQANFTYYAGDGVLANARDETVDGDWDQIIGVDNLMRFGQGSNDENIVYIRNVQLELDVEVARSTGKYSVEVAGLDDGDSEPETELRHSSYKQPLRRFRDSDE